MITHSDVPFPTRTTYTRGGAAMAAVMGVLPMSASIAMAFREDGGPGTLRQLRSLASALFW